MLLFSCQINPTPCDPKDCSTSGFFLPHHSPEFAQLYLNFCHPRKCSTKHGVWPHDTLSCSLRPQQGLVASSPWVTYINSGPGCPPDLHHMTGFRANVWSSCSWGTTESSYRHASRGGEKSVGRIKTGAHVLHISQSGLWSGFWVFYLLKQRK